MLSCSCPRCALPRAAGQEAQCRASLSRSALRQAQHFVASAAGEHQSALPNGRNDAASDLVAHFNAGDFAAAFADQRAGRSVAAENTNQRCAGQIGLFSCQIGDFLWGRGPSARHDVPFACDCVLRGSPPRSQGVS